MRKTAWIAIVLLSVSSILIFTAPRNTFSAEKPGKLIPVRIGIVSRSTLDMPFYVARTAASSARRAWRPRWFL